MFATMTTRALKLLDTDSWAGGLGLAVLTALLCAPFVYLALKGKVLLAVIAGGAVVLAALSLSLRWTFYVFLISNLVYLPYYLGRVALHPNDIVFAALVISFVMHRGLQMGSTPSKVPLRNVFAVYVAAAALSAVFAHNILLSVFPFLRLCVMFVLFYIVATSPRTITTYTALRFYTLSVAALSTAHTILFFLYQGAERIFGVSGIAFETFTLTALPLAVSYALWDERPRRRILFWLAALAILGGLAATQSRGPAVAVAITLPVLLVTSARIAGRLQLRRVRRACRRTFILGVALVTIFAISTPALQGYLERFTRLLQTDEYSTTTLRLSLWSAALDAFETAPITGIGIGNFKVIDDIVPHLRFDPVRPWIRQASAHNVALQTLSETGIIGLTALLALVAAALSRARRNFHQARAGADLPAQAGLFAMAVTIFATVFFMRVWTWGQEGYLLALFFGLIARGLTIQSSADPGAEIRASAVSPR